jgi:hypothetical protein
MVKPKQIKYPCGKCNKNVSKCSKAVLCKGSCKQWYHVKCTDLDLDDYKLIADNGTRWVCGNCESNESLIDTDEDNGLTNLELRNEIESLNAIIEALGKDLKETNNENKTLASRNVRLQEMVLEREEEIVKLKLALENLRMQSSQYNASSLSTSKKNKGLKNRRLEEFSLTLDNSFQALSVDEPNAMIARGNEDNEENQRFQLPKHCSRVKNASVQPVINTENRFSPIANIQDISFSDPPQVLHVKAQVHRTGELRAPPQKIKAPCQSDPRRKVVLLTDSHGKDVCHAMTELSQDFNFFVYLQPGAKLKQVLKSGHSMISNLTGDDVIVVLAGTNDIGVHEPGNLTIMQGMDQLMKWTTKTGAKILCVEIPYRCDKPFLNNDIFYANMAIKRIVRDYNGPSSIGYININDSLKRNHYTRHGLHLSRIGKTLLGSLIIDAVKSKIEASRPLQCVLNQDATESLQGQAPKVKATGSSSNVDLDAIEVIPDEKITDLNSSIHPVSCPMSVNHKLTTSSHISTQTSTAATGQPSDVSQILLEADLFTMSMDDFPPLSPPISRGLSDACRQTVSPAHQQPLTSFLETPPLCAKVE